MAITLRHDAAAVIPPSNQTTRKYGQNLVLQQQQQKYQTEQAGYDRFFDALKTRNQNAFRMQEANRRNQFQMDRDKNLFEQQQKVAQEERRRSFLDQARNQNAQFILEGIENGEFDAATSRKLQQNLVAESEALGNPDLDATQRADLLQQIRAQRTMLLAKRIEPPAPPSREDELKAYLGPNYDKYKDQPWVPDGNGGFTIADVPQEQAAEPPPPRTFGEFASQNPDEARKQIEEKMASINAGVADGLMSLDEGESVQDRAIKELEEPYAVMQSMMPSTPTLAPQVPPSPGSSPLEPIPANGMQSILEQRPTVAPQLPGQQPPVQPPAEMQSVLERPTVAPQLPGQQTPEAQFASDMQSILEQQPTAAPQLPGRQLPGQSPAEVRSILESLIVPSQQPEQPTYDDGIARPTGEQPSSALSLESQQGQMMPSESLALAPESQVAQESAIAAAQQYESSLQKLKSLKAVASSISSSLALARGRGGSKAKRRKELAEKKKAVEAEIKEVLKTMKDADKIVKEYYKNQILQQNPSARNLDQSGKTPRDFEVAKIELERLKKQYPDINSMPDAEKMKLKEVMATIRAGK